MVYTFFDKRSAYGAVKSAITSSQELAEQLRKPIIRIFERRKLQSSFIVNMWGGDLADMQLVSKFNKGIR